MVLVGYWEQDDGDHGDEIDKVEDRQPGSLGRRW